MVKRLIIISIIDAEEDEDNMALVYIKGYENGKWLVDIFDSDDLTIEPLNTDYEDIDSLNLDVINTKWCVKHVKNYALQNEFKIYNW